MNEEDIKNMKTEELLDLLKDVDGEKAKRAVIAACMLSEGMDMTFELFDDPKEALEAILSAISKVGKQYGIEFHSVNLRAEKLH